MHKQHAYFVGGFKSQSVHTSTPHGSLACVGGGQPLESPRSFFKTSGPLGPTKNSLALRDDLQFIEEFHIQYLICHFSCVTGKISPEN